MTLMSTLAAGESTFIRSSWTCDPPFCCPGPRNHRSEPGSPQRTLARPESCASSASRPWAMAPPPATDQPCATRVAAFLPVASAAGSVSRENTPGLCARTGPAGRGGRPAGGSAVSSTWPRVPRARAGGAGCAGQQRDRGRAAARGGRAGAGGGGDRHLPGHGRGTRARRPRGGRAGRRRRWRRAPPGPPRRAPGGWRWRASAVTPRRRDGLPCRGGVPRRGRAAAPRARRGAAGAGSGRSLPGAGVIWEASPSQGA